MRHSSSRARYTTALFAAVGIAFATAAMGGSPWDPGAQTAYALEIKLDPPAPSNSAAPEDSLLLRLSGHYEPAASPDSKDDSGQAATDSSAPPVTNRPQADSPAPPASATVAPTPPPTPTATATAPASITPSPAATPIPVSPSSEPTPAAPAAATQHPTPPKRVGIQSGHWKEADLPAELASLRGATGAAGDGWREVDVNLSVARQVVALLSQAGVQADLLPATVPVHYQADAFVALHADAAGNAVASGYKSAGAVWSAIPGKDDALRKAIDTEYQAATGLKEDVKTITQNMLQYYAFDNRSLQHAVAPTTPSVILEMGFLTNPSDRAILTEQSDKLAAAITEGILEFLGNR